MPALFHAPSNPLERQCDRCKPKVDDFDPISSNSQLLQPSHVRQSTQSALEREICSLLDKPVNFAKNEASSLDCCKLGPERR
jgi:hypothetical protein